MDDFWRKNITEERYKHSTHKKKTTENNIHNIPNKFLYTKKGQNPGQDTKTLK